MATGADFWGIFAPKNGTEVWTTLNFNFMTQTPQASALTESKKPTAQQVGNFSLIQETYLEDLGVSLSLWEHPIGSRLAYVKNQDSNKVFSVAFRTTPYDSTGVAHILEHIVLCGSKKYPVRDPFFSMLKRSLQNFMNAFTASDWTMYPFATNNEADFYNLMSVYLDAAFFPLLAETSFWQEGWRFELRSKVPAPKLEVKGVVFNEMKGAMSSKSEIVSRKTVEALFPNNTYHYNSGGQPEEILKLTWENLKKFHQNYYHPSNAWFYLYGDVDFEKAVAKIERDVLSKFQKNTTETAVGLAKRFDAPQEFTFGLPLEEKETEQDPNRHILYAWLTAPVTDSVEVLLLKILNQVLLGSSGSPLRKKLMESNLGKRLVDGSGFETDTRETFFVIGLQGVKAEDVKKAEDLILSALAEVKAQGIDRELIESCLHQLELDIREIDAGAYGEGLKLLFRFFPTWLHGGDFFYTLDLDKQLQLIRTKMQQPGFFEGLIDRYFLNNPHRAKVLFSPQADFYKKQEAAIANTIRKAEQSLSAQKVERLVHAAANLEILQNTKEDLSVLPKVELKDVHPETERIKPDLIDGFPIEPKEPIVFYRQNTNGMVYVDLNFSLPELSDQERLLLPSLSVLLAGAGTKKTSYSDLALKLFRYTGGVTFHPYVLPLLENERNVLEEGFSVNAKALIKNVDALFQILEELLLEISFHDLARIKSLLKQRGDALFQGIFGAGHSYAGSLALRHLHPVAHMEEIYGGITQVRFANQLHLEGEALDSWAKNLVKLATKIFFHSKPVFVCVAEEKHEKKLYQKMQTFMQAFSKDWQAQKTSLAPSLLAEKEIWLMNTPVSYVAKAFSVPKFLDPKSPALRVMASLLRSEFLHRTIREQGGAYGAMAGYDSLKGTFLLLSYRDPNLAKTWQNFDEGIRWIAKESFSQEELESAILQTFSAMDKPLSPAKKAYHDYNLRLQGMTKELQDAYREKLKACRKVDVSKLAKDWQFMESASAAITAEKIWEDNKAGVLNPERYKVFSVGS